VSNLHHLDQMKDFIAAAYGVERPSLSEESEEQYIPKFALDTFNMSETLLEMNIDRISSMLGDRTSAEIVLESCENLRNKMAEQDYQAVYEVGECLASILKDVTNDDTPEQLTESMQRNRYMYDSVIEDISDKKEKVLAESIEKIIDDWEMYSDTEDREGTFSEGVEYGYTLAAQKMREILEAHTKEEIEQDEREENNEKHY